MRTANITKEEFKRLLTDELIDELLFCEWEPNPANPKTGLTNYQQKCINIGDPILHAIEEYLKVE